MKRDLLRRFCTSDGESGSSGMIKRFYKEVSIVEHPLSVKKEVKNEID